MNLDNEIAQLMSEFAALMEKQHLTAMHEDLTMLGFRIITLIYYRHQPYTMTELAAAAGILVPSASVIIEKLEAAGYIERRHSEQDRRVIHLYLTGKGRALIEGHIDKTRLALKAALTHLSEADKTVVMEFLHSYINMLDDNIH